MILLKRSAPSFSNSSETIAFTLSSLTLGAGYTLGCPRLDEVSELFMLYWGLGYPSLLSSGFLNMASL